MKIIVVGATGTIGSAVADALASRHEVVRASRQGDVRVDLTDPASVEALFRSVTGVQAVVGCAGGAAWKPLGQLTDADFARSLDDKLMGQVRLVRAALSHVTAGGSVTVTSGVLAQRPMPGSAAVSLVNAGLEGFVRAAALEAPNGIRVNVISPPWVDETLAKLGMQADPHLSAAQVARAYVAVVEGRQSGDVIDPTRR